MSPNMKQILKWAIFVAILLIVWFLGGHYAKSQTVYYSVDLNYAKSTERVNPTFYMPEADWLYLTKRIGQDEIRQEFQQLVNRLKARIADEQDNDGRRAWRFVPKAEKDKAREAEQLYRDTLGTFERSQSQGTLLNALDPYGRKLGEIYSTDEQGRIWYEEPSAAITGIGKRAFHQAWNDEWQGGGGSYPLQGPGASDSDIRTLTIAVIVVVSIIFLAGYVVYALARGVK